MVCIRERKKLYIPRHYKRGPRSTFLHEAGHAKDLKNVLEDYQNYIPRTTLVGEHIANAYAKKFISDSSIDKAIKVKTISGYEKDVRVGLNSYKRVPITTEIVTKRLSDVLTSNKNTFVDNVKTLFKKPKYSEIKEAYRKNPELKFKIKDTLVRENL